MLQFSIISILTAAPICGVFFKSIIIIIIIASVTIFFKCMKFSLALLFRDVVAGAGESCL